MNPYVRSQPEQFPRSHPRTKTGNGWLFCNSDACDFALPSWEQRLVAVAAGPEGGWAKPAAAWKLSHPVVTCPTYDPQVAASLEE